MVRFSLSVFIVAAICGVNTGEKDEKEFTEVVQAPQNGPLRGFIRTDVKESDSEFGRLEQFTGIPYAFPPIKNFGIPSSVYYGNGRLRPPVELPSGEEGIKTPFNLGRKEALLAGVVWEETKDMTADFCPPCSQWLRSRSSGGAAFARMAFSIKQQVIGEEDCLRLNLYRPEGAKEGDLLPVVVSLPGGAFFFGDAAWYDGAFLAQKKKVIVVSVNYRVGWLGFMGTEEIARRNEAEFGEPTAGNFGIQDQRAALRWVQRNIAAFGGDPTKVTLAGVSSGGVSALLHVVNPLSKESPLDHGKGLFQAVLSLGPVLNSWQLMSSRSKAIQFNEHLAEHFIGCPPGGQQLDCLQSKDTKELMLSFTEAMLAGRQLRGGVKGEVSKFVPVEFPVSFPFTFALPMVDGTLQGLKEDPLEVLERTDTDKIHWVPIVLSAAIDEGGAFAGLIEKMLVDGDFEGAALRRILPHRVQQALGVPSLEESDERRLRKIFMETAGRNVSLSEDLFNTYVTDFNVNVAKLDERSFFQAAVTRFMSDHVQCGVRRWASLLQHCGAPVWVYVNTLGGHGGDQPFFWGRRELVTPDSSSAEPYLGGELVVDAVVGLVRDPEAAAEEGVIGGGWPQFGVEEPHTFSMVRSLTKEEVETTQQVGPGPDGASALLASTSCPLEDGKPRWGGPSTWPEEIRAAAKGHLPCSNVCALQDSLKGMAWRSFVEP